MTRPDLNSIYLPMCVSIAVTNFRRKCNLRVVKMNKKRIEFSTNGRQYNEF